MFRRIMLTTAVCALSAAAQAQDSQLTGSIGGFLSLLSDAEISDSSGSLDADGTAIGLRGELGTGTVFGYIDYQDSGRDGSVGPADFDLDTTETRVGFGVRTADPTMNFVGRLERYDVDAELSGVGGSLKADDDGAGVHVGIEAKTSDSATVFGSAGYLSLGDSAGPEFRLGIKARAQDKVEIFGEYRMMDLSGDSGVVDTELTDIRLGANFLF